MRDFRVATSDVKIKRVTRLPAGITSFLSPLISSAGLPMGLERSDAYATPTLSNKIRLSIPYKLDPDYT